MASLLCATAFASGGGTGDVASVVQSTWTSASGQIKSVVNNVVFPALDMVLAVAFFGKVAMSYFDYKKHGQFEWTGPDPVRLPGTRAHRAAVHLDHRRHLRIFMAGTCPCAGPSRIGVIQNIYLGICSVHGPG